MRGLPDHRVVDHILQGRLWIWVIGAALIGIVGMQVALLKLNTGINRAVEHSATLERQNAVLRASVSRLSAGERIQSAATRMGMEMPPAGEVRYLSVRGSIDARRAAAELRAPRPAGAAAATGGQDAAQATGAAAGPIAAGNPAAPGGASAPAGQPAPASQAPSTGQPPPAPQAPPTPPAPPPAPSAPVAAGAPGAASGDAAAGG